MIRNLDRRFAALAIAFGLLLITQTVMLLSNLARVGILDPSSWSMDLQLRLIQATHAAGKANMVLILAAAAAFFVWLHRAYGNLPNLGATPRWSAGWAIGWWFVPVMNIVRPLQILDELNLPAEGASTRGGIALKIWYASWLLFASVVPVMSILVVTHLDDDQTDELAALMLDDPIFATYYTSISAATLAACACVLIYAARVGRLQQARQRLLFAPS
jgi:hypothetical protein